MRMARFVVMLVSATVLAGFTSATGMAAERIGQQRFVTTGTGTETSAGPGGCQITPGTCTVDVGGQASSSLLGDSPFVTTLTVNWAAATPNGEGGSCAQATASTTLSNLRGSLTLTSLSGQACEIGATSVNVPHRFTGTYTMMGTVDNRSVTGAGSIYGRDDGLGRLQYVAFGDSQ